MKLSILQENLKQGLFAVSHIANKNISLPILNNIMIRAEKGNISLESTNLEIGIISDIRGRVEEDGLYTVDSKVFTDYVSLLPNQKINISKKDNNIKIECSNYKTKIKGMEAEEYPVIPKIENNLDVVVDVDEFKKALSQVIFAVSGNESRLELTGVLFNFNNNVLTMAATDSYRLSEKELKTKTNGLNEEKNIIIPAKTLQELIRIVSGIKEGIEEDKMLEIKFSENQILFILKSTQIISKLIEGQYPDYKQIIPKDPKTTARVNKQEFIRAVKTSSIFSKTGINDVNLDFPKDKNALIITSTSGQTGENTTNLDAEVRGEDNGIVVNCNYLLDGLNNIKDENIIIKITDNNTPCVISGEEDKKYKYIIMPIKQ
jgi:DNA polymerase III subunit beta